MEFWNSTLTEKSWLIMQELKQNQIPMVIIGGWAAYLWTRLHKSKDVDIVLHDVKDLDTLRTKYRVQKNDHLKKYEVKFDEIDLDIYVPFYSELAIPVQDIGQYTSKVDGFRVVVPEVLLILKQGAELDRKDSVKGQKDRVDIMTLLCFTGVNWEKYTTLLDKYALRYKDRLRTIISRFQDVHHLTMNTHTFAKKRKELLTQL